MTAVTMTGAQPNRAELVLGSHLRVPAASARVVAAEMVVAALVVGQRAKVETYQSHGARCAS